MNEMTVATYSLLRKKIEETLLLGQQKVEAAKVQTYWETGKYIGQHLYAHRDRADYGEEVLLRLSKDMGLHDSVLRRCKEFADAFPGFKICATWHKLTWGHYRALIAIEDEKQRFALAARADKEEWTCRDLEIKIRNFRWDKRAALSDGRPPSLLPVPVLGPFYTYRIIAPETVHSSSRQLLLDLGFSARLEMEVFPGARFPAGTIVQSRRRDEGEKDAARHAPIAQGNSIFKLRPLKPGEDLLYTYKAFVQKFIDADTFHLEFRLGFGQVREETIRLKGIDCPEMNTPEGRRAKKFVEDTLSGCEYITVKSVRTRKEKWGRYLGDVFFLDAKGKQVYLNNLLLEKGLAVRVRE